MKKLKIFDPEEKSRRHSKGMKAFSLSGLFASDVAQTLDESFTLVSVDVHSFSKAQQCYSMKKVAIQHTSSLREIHFLQSLSHPKIIPLVDLFFSRIDASWVLVFPLLETNLAKCIQAELLGPAHISFITYQVCTALNYMHSAGVIHRAISAEKILINEDCEIQLCGFRRANLIGDAPEEEKLHWSPSCDVAPEASLGDQRWSEASDMWSIGCVVAEMILRKPLFVGIGGSMGIFQNIIKILGIPVQMIFSILN